MEKTVDGRNVDPMLGLLSGEAAQMQVRRPWEAFPVELAPTPEMPSYHGLPMLKEPVWTWTIPAYFFVGGAAGAVSLLGATLALRGDRARRLRRRARWWAAGGDLLSAGLLIYDLGRPLRFLNMLRVFRPSSPMNLGSWILTASGAANTAGVLFAERPGLLGAIGRTAELAGGLLGMPLAGYTAVLLSTTAIPVWQESRRSLPFLFMSSGVTAAASLLELGPLDRWEARVVRRYAIAGKAAELAATLALHREAARVPRVARPLRRGASGALLGAATVLTATSLVASLWPGQSRKTRLLGALSGLVGSLAMRYALTQAGRASARDPHASFELQRTR